jgi:hypothetical protein
MAPLAQSLQNKKAGDSLLFNGTNVVIEEIF